MTTEAEDFLKRYHARFPGCSSTVFGGRDSSYERLVGAVETTPASRLLDIACGDGFLIECFLQAWPDVEPIGIDMSFEELESGRQRLGDRAVLVEGRAQALPFEDANFDVVVSHMAMMLIKPLEPVLDEIRRVLRPGGQLVVVTGRRGAQSTPALDAYREVIGPWYRAEKPAPFGLVEPRATSEEGWRGLLGEGFESVQVQAFDQQKTASVEKIVEHFLLMYDPFVLSQEAQAAIPAALREALTDLADDGGQLSVSTPMLLVTARNASP